MKRFIQNRIENLWEEYREASTEQEKLLIRTRISELELTLYGYYEGGK